MRRAADNVLEVSVVDAKSPFDTLLKNAAASRQDRRNALDLASLRQQVQARDTLIRWVPHPRMIVDIMTKANVTKGNAALTHFLQTG